MPSNLIIFPSVTPTTNGNVALLSWQGEVDLQILKALRKHEYLAHYTAVGYLNVGACNHRGFGLQTSQFLEQFYCDYKSGWAQIKVLVYFW